MATALQNATDVVDRIGGSFVFPDADDSPPSFGQRSRSLPIAFNSTGELGRPIPFVRGRLTPMLRTRVPEASVDEHRDLTCGEHHIRTDATTREIDPEVLPKSVTETMQSGTQGNLRFGVDSPNRSHVPGSAFGGWLGVPTRWFPRTLLTSDDLHTVSVFRAEPLTSSARHAGRWTPATCSHGAIEEGQQ